MYRLTLLGLALILPTAVQAASWTVAEGSAIRFEAYLQGVAVPGRFERFEAAIELDPDDLAAAWIAVEIDTASIATGHQDRDTVLRAPDLLAVGQWPSARFASDRIEHLGGDAYQASGQLTIRDAQKDAVLPFTLTIADHPDDPGLLQALARGELTISRLAFGVGQGDWASTAMVGENVVIRFEILAAAPR
jgi:polyisoprenoid-binding protein YceI